MKSAKFERLDGNLDDALELARQGLQLHPTCWKLWLIASQVCFVLINLLNFPLIDAI
jgi:hypothetical protein